MQIRSVALVVWLAGAGAASARDSAKPEPLPTGSEAALDGERRQFEQLANAHRLSVGCASLRWDRGTAAVAQAHAEDMVRRNYFSHKNPDGRSPFDRLRAADVRYMAAAENIAFGYRTAAGVLEGWINSKGHRRNLENCRYTHHGVGLNDGRWVHVFIGR
jgi:uncharacterized protein YkwD